MMKSGREVTRNKRAGEKAGEKTYEKNKRIVIVSLAPHHQSLGVQTQEVQQPSKSSGCK